MSKIDKLERRFLSIPSDFQWSELVTLLKGYGYEEKNAQGSRRAFVKKNKKIFLHEPHPDKTLCRQAIRQIIVTLESHGIKLR